MPLPAPVMATTLPVRSRRPMGELLSDGPRPRVQ
jgi:hypothetical protein